MGVQTLSVNVDSKLVASQINGNYEAYKEYMIRYLNKAKEYIGCFKIFKIQNIPKNKNQKADVLSKLASVAFNHLTKEILVETLDVPSMDVEEVNAVVEGEGETWTTPIVNCLERGIWPEDQNEARTLRMKINQYVMEEGHAFKGKIGSGKGHLERVLLANNAPGRKRRNTKCDSCQIHSPIPKLPKTLMTSIMAPWPFFQWGMDVLGSLPKAPGKVRFVIVAVDYFTKWIEAKPIAKTTGNEVKKFVWDNIVCRYGLPKIDAHRTSLKTSNGETLYSLTFISEAVILAEIGMPTHRTMMIKEGNGNEEEMRLNLDLLTERREAAAIREARYKMKIEQYYNKRVRPMSFKLGEYVYWKNKASRVENLGKLGPKWEGPYLIVEVYQNGSHKLRTMDDKEVPRVWHAINLRRCYL
ncbi:reverse transcriptase domain-containing protein [Tanacetum coccineum]